MKIAESAIQQSAVIWLTNNYCLKHHEPRVMIFSVPNESESSYDVQKKINTGMMKGAADCVILLPGGVCLFAECKTPTGYQSPAQKSFQSRVQGLGFVYFVYKSLAQFIESIAPHLLKVGLEVKNG